MVVCFVISYTSISHYLLYSYSKHFIPLILLNKCDTYKKKVVEKNTQNEIIIFYPTFKLFTYNTNYQQQPDCVVES